MHFKLLSVFLLLGLFSCKAYDRKSQLSSMNPKNEVQEYLAANQEGLFWFRDVPVGNSGIPLLMFKLFPEIFPDIWHDNWAKEIGLFSHPDPNHILPYGLGWNMGSRPIIDLPGLRNIRMQVVNFSCASCHTGRVVDSNGHVQLLIGAPSTQMDLGLWRSKLANTVKDPRYTLENFNKALASKKAGWLYQDPLLLAQETLDTQVFKGKGELILGGIRDSVLDTYNGVHDFLGLMGYDEKTRAYLDKGALGQLEGGFGSAVSKLVPREYSNLNPDERKERLFEYFPEKRNVVDFMSVWRQNDRRLAQWDGNIKAKILRNLGAELGVIPNPELVSYKNAEITTDFVGELPPPSWPFALDASKLERGREIFESSCLGCHNATTPMVALETVKTDPARSPGLTKLARQELSKLIIAACRDRNNPECQLSFDEVITERITPRGYLAGPLDGIWARSPYLHNGSVPTLAQLLQPSTRSERFYRGNITYDSEQVGFTWDAKEYEYAVIYDTNLSGYSNEGHSDLEVFFGGIDFEEDKESREALLEYLKSL